MKNLLNILTLVLILVAIPLTITLVFQKQDLVKRAGEFPPAVVFIPRTLTLPQNQEFNLTLLLQGEALQTKIIDGMDVVFKYPKDVVELIKTTDDKAVNISPDFPSSLNILLNTIRSADNNSNYVVLSIQTKLINGQRLPYDPEKDPITGLSKDLVLGTVKFKPLRIGTAGVEFDILRTVVAGGGINTTNIDLTNDNQRNAYASITAPLYSILRLDPNKILDGYTESFTTTLTGSGFETGQKVKIGDTECLNAVVLENGTKITCSVPSGIVSGNKTVTLLTSSGEILATLDNGFYVYSSTDPIIGFKVIFNGSLYGMTNDIVPLEYKYQNQYAKVTIIGNNVQYTNNKVLLSAQYEKDSSNINSKVFYETLKDEGVDDYIPLVGFLPGKYTVLFKGPKHLQRRFEVDLISGTNLISRDVAPTAYLPGGDLPLSGGQDGKINSIDYNFIVNHYDDNDFLTLQSADLNFNGAVDAGDVAIIANTLSEKLDEDE